LKKFNIKSIITDILLSYFKDSVPSSSAESSFYILLFLFPFLLFIIELMRFIPVIHIGELLRELEKLVPQSTYSIILHITQMDIEERSERVFILSFMIMLWSAITAVKALIRGMNKAFDRRETRGFLIVNAISILYTLEIIVLIIFSMLLVVYGRILGIFILKYFGSNHTFFYLWSYLRYIVAIVTMILIFTTLFMYTPNHNMRMKDVMPGAIFSTVGWIVTSMAFSYYVNNNVNYGLLYGSLGGIIALLSWLYLSSNVILIGAELNAVLYFKRNKIDKVKK
jgi:membrane protein